MNIFIVFFKTDPHQDNLLSTSENVIIKSTGLRDNEKFICSTVLLAITRIDKESFDPIKN